MPRLVSLEEQKLLKSKLLANIGSASQRRKSRRHRTGSFGIGIGKKNSQKTKAYLGMNFPESITKFDDTNEEINQNLKERTLVNVTPPPMAPKIPVKFNDVNWRNIKREEVHTKTEKVVGLEENKKENLRKMQDIKINNEKAKSTISGAKSRPRSTRNIGGLLGTMTQIMIADNAKQSNKQGSKLESIAKFVSSKFDTKSNI